MAHQDYVSRASNKKNNPYKGKADQQNSAMPLKVKFIGLVTLAAIAGFSYFLWSIKDQKAEPVNVPVANTRVAASSKTALPEPPKEKWAYRKELESKEIEVGQYEVKEGGPYKMQCGSFRTRKQAEVLKANIAFTGLESFIRKATGTSSDWYQVRLGPYARKRLAEKDKHKLKSNSVNGCQISNWQ